MTTCVARSDRYRFLASVLTILCMAVGSMIASRDSLAQSAQTGSIIQQLQDLRVAGDTSPLAAQALKDIETRIPADAAYALRRELAKTQMFVLQDSLDSDENLKRNESLRKLAKARARKSF